MNGLDANVNYHDLSSLQQLRSQAKKDEAGAIKQAAQQFESVFMGMLMQGMRKANASIGEDNPLNSNATEFFRDMQDQQLAAELGKTGALGLADLMVQQLRPDLAQQKTTAHQLRRDQFSQRDAQPMPLHKATMRPYQAKALPSFQLDPERIVMPATKTFTTTPHQTSPLTTQQAISQMSSDPSMKPSNMLSHRVSANSTDAVLSTQRLAPETVWQADGSHQHAEIPTRRMAVPEASVVQPHQSSELAFRAAPIGGTSPALQLGPEVIAGATRPISMPQAPLQDRMATHALSPLDLSSIPHLISAADSAAQSMPEVKRAASTVLDSSSPLAFVKSLWPAAQQAAQRLDLDPMALIAQAALETGWGQKMPTTSQGMLSQNLFGIKASANWQGDVTTVDTLEYRQGVAVKEKAKFRAYDSVEQSLHDYVDLLQQSDRYQTALQHTNSPKQYFQHLQAAGYATDPHYAQKIWAIFSSDTLQQARNLLSTTANVDLAGARRAYHGG
jgi:flagellar rod assembly protein/muramidase FlgJ